LACNEKQKPWLREKISPKRFISVESCLITYFSVCFIFILCFSCFHLTQWFKSRVEWGNGECRNNFKVFWQVYPMLLTLRT
jgi:hypothetical protein